MKKYDGALSILLGVCFIAMLLLAAAWVGASTELKVMTAQSIERGYALYCPLDGKLAWVDECNEDEE